jgi:hypothetical protein
VQISEKTISYQNNTELYVEIENKKGMTEKANFFCLIID